MKILITTYGSLGDVQPYIALGTALMNRGHLVAMATSIRFKTFVERYGFDFMPMDDGLLAIIDTDQGKEMVETATNIFGVIRQNRRLAKQIAPMRRDQLYELWEIASTSRPDFILYHPKTSVIPHIAEKLGIGCALVTPIPMFVPTSEYPFIGLPEMKLGGWYNRLSYRIIATLTGLFLGKLIETFRRDVDLPPLTGFDLLKTGDGRDIPVLHIFSNTVLPHPADWPPSAYTTGYCFLDRDREWEPPPELLSFLDGGPPPVYVGFGSMTGRNPAELTRTVVKALELAGVRGIIATGWGGLTSDDLPHSVFPLTNAPHDWLFQRVAAVVHHGGAGTTAAALRAGKPSVVIPFFIDQPFWARRVYSLGAGPKPVPRKHLTTANLTTAILEALADTDIKRTADRIGNSLRREDGVGNTVEVIEKIIEDQPTRHSGDTGRM